MQPALLYLEDSLTRLSLLPERGASLVNWTIKATGQPLLRPSDDAALAAGTPRRLACYPLAPWSNRIANGGFDCPDGWLALSANTDHDSHPIHGSAWQQAWHVEQHSTGHARLSLDSREPFAYRAELDISLNEGCLRLRLQVTHLADEPAWHGLGLHPYLPRTAATRLQTVASQVWLGPPGELPSQPGAIPAQWDFEQRNCLPDTLVDHAFSGWDGRCVISQEDAGYQLSCRASGADYFLLFCPPSSEFFCFEPVSHPINAHHLPGRPGLRLLRKNEAAEVDFSLHYQPFNAPRETG